MAKVNVTKTLAQIHFEDLEPHRFEDLIRQLLYDFKDWQSIEATGRAGSDNGFDARAWENLQATTNKDDESEDEGEHPMDGNVWKIQCKRESTLGPKRVEDIINEGVDEKDPPYGYILAAPTNFSTKSYDTFRKELRKRGVMEFYLWGRAELEDMLYMPKHDHILFAFTGISLSTRRRSRATEVKFSFNNKNKLLRIWGENGYHRGLHESVLLRDINDEHYPFKKEYADFDKKPRWLEVITISYHPMGLIFDIRKHYGYIDRKKKEFDFVQEPDLLVKKSDRRNYAQDTIKANEKVRDFWEHLPRKNQAIFHVRGILFFSSMLAIDDKGDGVFDCPHIYVDRSKNTTLVDGNWGSIVIASEEIEVDREGYKKICYFPKKVPKPKKGKVYKNKYAEWDEDTNRLFLNGSDWVKNLYDVDGKHSFLDARDVLPLRQEKKNEGSRMGEKYLEVLHKYETTVEEYVKENNYPGVKNEIEKQVGRKVKEEEALTVFEIKPVYDWGLK